MTAPCRCRDLRRAMLGLVRASKIENKAVRPVVELTINSSYLERAQAFDELIESSKSLQRSLRLSRRLLRETRPGKRERPEPDTFHSPTEALNRIMAEWRLVEALPHSETNLRNLHSTLRSVSSEFGFGGEDGCAG